MAKYILGVDGGGTKSHMAVFDNTGKFITAVKYGPLNHESLEGSYDELKERLGELLPRVLRDIGATPADVSYAVFGLAGVDTQKQAELISGIIRKLGFGNILVCNDAVLGVPAGCPGGAGICAINGTGFKLAAIDSNGFISDTCGLGAYTDDRGGGTWYGERTCAEVYNALFKFGKPTKMRKMLFELFEVTDKYEYHDYMTHILSGESGHYGSVALNSIVFDAAAAGDETALTILDESARQYGGAIARLAIDMYFPCDEPIYVTLAGSVFVKQRFSILHDMVKRQVAEILGSREVLYTVLTAPPVAGAVILAMQRAGLTLDDKSAADGEQSAADVEQDIKESLTAALI